MRKAYARLACDSACPPPGRAGTRPRSPIACPPAWFIGWPREGFGETMGCGGAFRAQSRAAGADRAGATGLAHRTGGARRTKKSNLSRTLKTMSRYGLVELRAGQRGRLIPRVTYDQVRLDVSLTSAPGRVESARHEDIFYR